MALNPDKKVSYFVYEVEETVTTLVSDRNILYDSYGDPIVDDHGNEITTRSYS